MEQSDQIRWAVVGIGRFGTTHAKVLAQSPGVSLAGLCSRSPEPMATVAADLGVTETTRDYRELFSRPDVHAVTVATHWQQHHEIALAALQAGKHVLLEKPMAESSDQCRELLAAAKQAAGHFMVGHVCRFDPRVTLAKSAIDEGRIGRIVSMHARRNLPRAPGHIRLDKISPLMGDGIHDADLMMWFIGRTPSSVYGREVRVNNFQYPDLGWAMLHFGDDAVGVVETVWCLPESTPTTIDAKMEVIGTDGKLKIDCAHTGLTILDNAGSKMPDTMYWPEQHGNLVGALTHEVNYFANCIRTGKSPTVAPPAEAATAVAVIEAAEKSARTGNVVQLAVADN